MSAAGRRAGTAVLNTWIALEEKAFLQEQAARHRMTVTMFLRFLVRQAMREGSFKGVDPEAVERGPTWNGTRD